MSPRHDRSLVRSYTRWSQLLQSVCMELYPPPSPKIVHQPLTRLVTYVRMYMKVSIANTRRPATASSLLELAEYCEMVFLEISPSAQKADFPRSGQFLSKDKGTQVVIMK